MPKLPLVASTSSNGGTVIVLRLWPGYYYRAGNTILMTFFSLAGLVISSLSRWGVTWLIKVSNEVTSPALALGPLELTQIIHQAVATKSMY